MRLLQANRASDLYLTDWENVWLIPMGWCDIFCMSNGYASGPDNIEDGPELYGYGPTHDYKNSPVDTLYFSFEDLARLDVVCKDTALYIHPNLFAHLDAINTGAA